jgi:hypothetical protein
MCAVMLNKRLWHGVASGARNVFCELFSLLEEESRGTTLRNVFYEDFSEK